MVTNKENGYQWSFEKADISHTQCQPFFSGSQLQANLGQGSPETTRAKNWPTNIRKRLTELVEKGKLTSELGPFSLQTLDAGLQMLIHNELFQDGIFKVKFLVAAGIKLKMLKDGLPSLTQGSK